jgi:hemolysin activation/secretion protein
MDFTVKETIPLHGVFEINNTGTQATEEWRLALTLQHLNLTRHDDVLTITVPTSIDFSTLQSVAGSYYVPYRAGKGGTFTVFGGYSELDSQDIVPGINLLGEGWFAGAQASYNLVRNDAHELRMSLGFAHQYIEDELILDAASTVPRSVTIAPVSLIFAYSSVQPGFAGGRNFLTSQSSANFAGVLGADDDVEFQSFRETAEADYWVQRLQYARIQPLGFPREREDGQQWILFLKLDGQYASGPLIPAEQKAVGGMDNVRGYEEREILGDYGISGSLELRSPIASRSWSGKAFGKTTADRLQFVAFVDGASMYIDDAPPSVEDSTNLLSVGLGIRLAVTGYTQLKLDYGFPLEETFLSDSGGRGHFAFEFQF